MQGSPIRRIGYWNWLRNIAVALGNAPNSERVIAALRLHAKTDNETLREHVEWALQEQSIKTSNDS